MRRLALVGLVLVLPDCGHDGTDRTAVVPFSVKVSADRRTLTVATRYPRTPFCAKQPDGIDVDIRGDVVVISAFAKSVAKAGESCTMECGFIEQTITLDSPVSDGVRFEAPPGADPGCGSPPAP